MIGWFQGRLEWGPRALGNRSILGDPRRADMKDILNLKIKRRESFRPFAPSILREAVKDWFETDDDVPFMMQVFRIQAGEARGDPGGHPCRRLGPPADRDLGRQSALCAADREPSRDLTGVPIVLNTSFNENEPVVCKPEEAHRLLPAHQDGRARPGRHLHRAMIRGIVRRQRSVSSIWTARSRVGRPAEFVARLGDVADQLGRIARPPRTHRVRHGAAGDPRGLGDCLPHAVARTAAEVEGFVNAAFGCALQPVERLRWAVGEVAHMHEVADARTVGCRIVRAQQGDGGAETENGVGGERQQMGLGIVRLADRAIGVGAGGIEVAQRRRPQATAGGGRQRALDPRLELGVGADRRDAWVSVNNSVCGTP